MQTHGIVLNADASIVSGNTSSGHPSSGITVIGDVISVFGNTVSNNMFGIRFDTASATRATTNSIAYNNNLIGGGQGIRVTGGSGNAFDNGPAGWRQLLEQLRRCGRRLQ